jgi:hypothetical protein
MRFRKAGVGRHRTDKAAFALMVAAPAFEIVPTKNG